MTTLFLDYANGRIAYDQSGAGPLVVCVPSMGDVRGEYRFLAPRLAQAGYRVVTMDVRGHGESSTAWDDFSVAGIGSDIVALIRHLNAGPAVVVGDSMAAGATVWAAAEVPELVACAVLVGPFVRSEPSLFTHVLFGTMFSRPWGPAMWQWYYKTLYPTQKPEDFAEYVHKLRKNLAERGRMEALQKMLAASKSASEQRLGMVKAPALVLMGTKDPDFKDPEAEARWVAEQVNAQMHMIEGAGHYPHAEMPDAVAPLVLEFLAQQAAPAAAEPMSTPAKESVKELTHGA
jgi:pimeloyl-ACP methyl ester carboxylesterase